MPGIELRQRLDAPEGAHILEVSGEVELSTAAALRDTLNSALESAAHAGAPPCLVLEMSRVGFLDSSGVGVLVGAYKRSRSQGGTLALAAPHSRVRRVLEIAGLLGALPVYASLHEALEALHATEDYTAEAAEAKAAVGETAVAEEGTS